MIGVYIGSGIPPEVVNKDLLELDTDSTTEVLKMAYSKTPYGKHLSRIYETLFGRSITLWTEDQGWLS